MRLWQCDIKRIVFLCHILAGTEINWHLSMVSGEDVEGTLTCEEWLKKLVMF
jgi:hypothetical protein